MAPENSQGESPEKKAFSNFVNFFLFKWANAMQNTTNSIAGHSGFWCQVFVTSSRKLLQWNKFARTHSQQLVWRTATPPSPVTENRTYVFIKNRNTKMAFLRNLQKEQRGKKIILSNLQRLGFTWTIRRREEEGLSAHLDMAWTGRHNMAHHSQKFPWRGLSEL